MYLSRSSLARLVRVDARDKRSEPLMIRSAEFQPPRWLGRVLAPVGGEGGMMPKPFVFTFEFKLPGAVLLRSPFGFEKLSLLVKLPFRVRELLRLLMGRGGRPDKSLVSMAGWNERVNVFLGVVGGAGVRFESLPFRDDARLFEELAPWI